MVGNTCHPADSALSCLLPLPPDTTLVTVSVPSGYSTDLHQQSWEDRLCLLLNTTWDHRIFQAGGDLRRSLFQPSVTSRVSCEISPGRTGLYPVWSWNSPRMKRDCTAYLGNLFQCLVVLKWKKYFFPYSSPFSFFHPEPLLFQLVPVVSSPPTLSCEEPGSISAMTSLQVQAGYC